jgi:hypothetical protein
MKENPGPVLGLLTPQEYVRTHPITIELTKRGVSDDQLAAMRFRDKDQAHPFDQWACVWGNGMPVEAMPFVKAYCTLKWLILDDPPPSRDKDDAWRYASAAMMAPVVAMGLRHQEAQRQRAQRFRVKVTEDGQTIRQVAEQLARKLEYREESAPQLWRHFYAELDELGLDPEEVTCSDPRKGYYKYMYRDKRRKITYGQFANLVSAVRTGRSV